MNIPANLKYSKTDEWFNPADGSVGLSDFAQKQLSDIVYVEIKVSIGDNVEAGKPIATVDSVKASAEVYAPVSGKVVARNDELPESPATVNSDPYGAAWLIKIEGGEPGSLLDSTAYQKHCDERAQK